jgi:hypothetical protein
MTGSPTTARGSLMPSLQLQGRLSNLRSTQELGALVCCMQSSDVRRWVIG